MRRFWPGADLSYFLYKDTRGSNFLSISLLSKNCFIAHRLYLLLSNGFRWVSLEFWCFLLSFSLRFVEFLWFLLIPLSRHPNISYASTVDHWLQAGKTQWKYRKLFANHGKSLFAFLMFFFCFLLFPLGFFITQSNILWGGIPGAGVFLTWVFLS